MADDIRMRRLNTEKENIKRIDSTKIQVEEQKGFLNKGIVFKITFNLRDHPYNLDLLKEKSEFSVSAVDDSGDNEIYNTSVIEEEAFENNDPIDEMEDREYEFDLIVPK